MSFVYIQTDDWGTRFISSWPTEDEANEGRLACTEDGYATTPLMEAPEMDWDAVEAVLAAGPNADVPAGIAPDVMEELFAALDELELWEG